jgi:hypothetical protein
MLETIILSHNADDVMCQSQPAIELVIVKKNIQVLVGTIMSTL